MIRYYFKTSCILFFEQSIWNVWSTAQTLSLLTCLTKICLEASVRLAERPLTRATEKCALVVTSAMWDKPLRTRATGELGTTSCPCWSTQSTAGTHKYRSFVQNLINNAWKLEQLFVDLNLCQYLDCVHR